MTTAREAQIELLSREYRGLASEGRRWGPDGPVWFMYRNDHILVRDEYWDRACALLLEAGYLSGEGPNGEFRKAQAESARVWEVEEAAWANDRDIENPFGLDEVREQAPGEQVVQGVRLLRLNGSRRQPLDALRALRDGTDSDRGWLQGLGRGVATPDHLLSITNGTFPGASGGCPATEPVPVPAGTPRLPRPNRHRLAGEGVRVAIVDTGLDREAVLTTPWLAGVRGNPDPNIGTGTPRPLGPYAGHGTFIAGVVRTMAPAAEVVVRRGFGRAGAVFESTLVRKLDWVLQNDYPDVISLSAGTYAFDPTGLLTFEMFHRNRLRHHKGIVLVAAAGNQGSRKFFWPAAAPWSVSAGALDRNWRADAEFSNHGGWVDVMAPGEDLVNVYPQGTYTYQEPPNQGNQADFTGLASWSGTSFSTPVVAGAIAARMSRTGENGRTAARALLRRARRHHHLPGVGAALIP